MEPVKILFVNSEIFPYLPESEMSKIGRELPQGIQERKKEIRAFMPRFGCINERKHQLHEVIRLSGMNIVVGESDHPLIIKVASISSARIQVYFIDNEDFFRRKSPLRDENGKFYEDNGERAIFFARGVLETVKKLRWAPDIIHCQGWITQVLPIYLKKVYNGDPIFASSKVVTSIGGDIPAETFSPSFKNSVLVGGMTAADAPFSDAVDGTELARISARYADGVILSSKKISAAITGELDTLGVPVLPYDEASVADGSYIDRYNDFYDSLLK